MKKAKRIVALALSAVMAAGLLAGCGGTAPSSISASVCIMFESSLWA